MCENCGDVELLEYHEWDNDVATCVKLVLYKQKKRRLRWK